MNSSQQRPHIVLLHGLGRTYWSMAVLARYLRSSGYDVTNFGYRSRHLPIDTQVTHLADRLTREGLADKPISFVTHSLGSIVVRRFATLHHGNFQLQRAVMLGPPNQGSETARRVSKVGLIRSLLGPALLEVSALAIEPATDKLEIGIIAGGKGGERGFSPHIGGDNDAIVSVEETKLPGMKDHLVVGGLHSFLMYQPAVMRQVLHFVERGCFQRS